MLRGKKKHSNIVKMRHASVLVELCQMHATPRSMLSEYWCDIWYTDIWTLKFYNCSLCVLNSEYNPLYARIWFMNWNKVFYFFWLCFSSGSVLATPMSAACCKSHPRLDGLLLQSKHKQIMAPSKMTVYACSLTPNPKSPLTCLKYSYFDS